MMAHTWEAFVSFQAGVAREKKRKAELLIDKCTIEAFREAHPTL